MRNKNVFLAKGEGTPNGGLKMERQPATDAEEGEEESNKKNSPVSQLGTMKRQVTGPETAPRRANAKAPAAAAKGY